MTWVASWYLVVPGELKMLSGMYKTLEELEQAVYKVSWTSNWWYIYGTICRFPFDEDEFLALGGGIRKNSQRDYMVNIVVVTPWLPYELMRAGNSENCAFA